jgi:hypothetical protein
MFTGSRVRSSTGGVGFLSGYVGMIEILFLFAYWNTNPDSLVVVDVHSMIVSPSLTFLWLETNASRVTLVNLWVFFFQNSEEPSGGLFIGCIIVCNIFRRCWSYMGFGARYIRYIR